jgi:hypothetical protein
MATQKLNQVIAVAKTVKGEVHTSLTKLHREATTPGLFAGLSRTYKPKDEEGAERPPEHQIVQRNGPELLDGLARTLTRLFDTVATMDAANTLARADVEVDGVVVLHDVPATTLLFLEKQLDDVHTFIVKLPILEPDEVWSWDDASNAYRSDPTTTVRTQKVPRNHVLYEATKEHPAQVQMYTEDVVEGYWTLTKFSGALPASRVEALANRATELRLAVKRAREVANTQTAEPQRIGAAIFDYLLA